MSRTRLGLAISIVTLLVFADAALPSVLGDTGFYKGSTSQGKTIYFSLTENGRQIERGKISWTADCQVIGPKGYRDVARFSVNVSRNGVFSLVGGYTATLGDGFTGEVDANLNGRFPSATRAVGTFRGRVTVLDPNGRVADRCDSDRVNWHVKHR